MKELDQEGIKKILNILLYKWMESAHLENYAQLHFFHLEKDVTELEKIIKRMTTMLQCC